MARLAYGSDDLPRTDEGYLRQNFAKITLKKFQTQKNNPSVSIANSPCGKQVTCFASCTGSSLCTRGPLTQEHFALIFICFLLIGKPTQNPPLWRDLVIQQKKARRSAPFFISRQ
ncbi:MAG: hypothetical protein E7639_06185 [Ruminococcaceae bacterium]|nr:hypothetical protein [Oscillospiraceae bacterium]